jgi:hypothetical protein
MKNLMGLYSEKYRKENLMNMMQYKQNYITDHILDGIERYSCLNKLSKTNFKLQRRHDSICDDIQTLNMKIEIAKKR